MESLTRRLLRSRRREAAERLRERPRAYARGYFASAASRMTPASWSGVQRLSLYWRKILPWGSTTMVRRLWVMLLSWREMMRPRGAARGAGVSGGSGSKEMERNCQLSGPFGWERRIARAAAKLRFISGQ